jgi:hypothetical protein
MMVAVHKIGRYQNGFRLLLCPWCLGLKGLVVVTVSVVRLSCIYCKKKL